jgi:hypothetical protein
VELVTVTAGKQVFLIDPVLDLVRNTPFTCEHRYLANAVHLAVTVYFVGYLSGPHDLSHLLQSLSTDGFPAQALIEIAEPALF